MPEVSACPPSVVADTIMRTIELGVTITDAAGDDVHTTISCTRRSSVPRWPAIADVRTAGVREAIATRSPGR